MWAMRLSCVVALLCAGLNWVPLPAESVEAAERPNVILVMADDQGWGDTGYNGHPHLKTPNLDAMAAAGLRLNHFYTAHFNCSPTRASIDERSPWRAVPYATLPDDPPRYLAKLDTSSRRAPIC